MAITIPLTSSSKKKRRSITSSPSLTSPRKHRRRSGSPRTRRIATPRSFSPTSCYRRKGQELMAAQGRWVSRKDVPYLLDPGARKVQMVSLKWGERDVELIQLFNKLLRRQGE